MPCSAYGRRRRSHVIDVDLVRPYNMSRSSQRESAFGSEGSTQAFGSSRGRSGREYPMTSSLRLAASLVALSGYPTWIISVCISISTFLFILSFSIVTDVALSVLRHSPGAPNHERASRLIRSLDGSTGCLGGGSVGVGGRTSSGEAGEVAERVEDGVWE